MRLAIRHRCTRAATVIALAALASACGSPFGASPAGRSATDVVAAPPVCTPEPGLAATVIGPIASDPVGSASHNYPWFASNANLTAHGYVEEEYFICGFSPSQAGDYTTRLIVRRPADAKAFSGTVLAEWQNVTAGYEQDILWAQSHEHIMRAGYAYVGISAQRDGNYAKPNGLAQWSPTRYGQLHWPMGASGSVFIADLASYDIYTQAMQALRSPHGASPLGGLTPKWIIATGGSQSGGTLIVDYHTQQLLFKAADAFLPFIVTTGSVGDHPVDVAFPQLPEVIGTRILLVNSETDLDLTHRPDTDAYRQWEVAGATHADQHDFDYNFPLLQRDLGLDNTVGDKLCASNPRSRIPFHHVLNAAMDQMVRWLETDQPPPAQPRFQYGSDGKPLRDAQENILGGIRLPEHAAATATNNRNNSGSDICFLYGRHQPFDAATLMRLYSSRDNYLRQFGTATTAAVSSGVLLTEDAADSLATAAAFRLPY